MPLPRPSAHERLQASFLLGEARAVIGRPEAWIPGWLFAQDALGRGVEARDPSAVRWSAMGALRKAAPKVSGLTALIALDALDEAADGSFAIFDGSGVLRSHVAILDVFDRAREALNADDETDPEAAR